ncbi:UNVERIFIED_ORG: hypothetical protein GGE63_005412 [Rhizobium esperanzae]
MGKKECDQHLERGTHQTRIVVMLGDPEAAKPHRSARWTSENVRASACLGLSSPSIGL